MSFAKVRAKLSVTLTAMAIFFAVTGCEQMRLAAPQKRPAPSTSGLKPGSKPVAPVVAVPKPVAAETTVGAIRVAKTLPPEVVAGREFAGELTLTAQGGATNVVVRDAIPAGATYLRSEPAAAVEGGELVWKLGDLSSGQVVKVKAWFQADKPGVPSSVAVITANLLSATVCVGKPMLVLDKTGPEVVLLGAEISYLIVVRNVGSAPARGVGLSDGVPAGLNHSSGRSELVFELGDLAPGQAKPTTVTLKANQRGKACSTATVTSASTGKISKEVCTLVLVPALKVEKTGTKEQVIGRNADYEISVSNTGDTALKNVLITDITPAECSIVAAPGATMADNKASWLIAELKPGAKVTETIKLTAKTAGASCNTVTASCGVLSDSAKACTLWKGIPALTFELSDSPDPIQIGESTTYTIKIINQGSGDIHNVKVTPVFDDLMLPISSPQGTVNGPRVIFPTVATIGAKQAVTYTVQVKGTTAGDSRCKVEVFCDELKLPLTREESTAIY
ncbi:MAG: hypothetical protein QM813_25410 [Verrucomicrobiota bacterium]